MSKADVKALLEAGVHFGHRTEKWNPKMKPYIFEARNGIYVINLIKTAELLDKASNFLRETASKGGKILFVGCKKQSQEIIKELAQKSNAFYVTERWLGGTLTNLKTIHKSVARMKSIDDMEKNGKIHDLPKQEASVLRRENLKLHRNLDGIRDMEKIPTAMVIVDTVREDIAVREAKRLGIPVVSINDTNSDPDAVEFPIPGNDDAIRSIRVILEYLNDAIIAGSGESSKNRGEKSDANNELNAVSA